MHASHFVGSNLIVLALLNMLETENEVISKQVHYIVDINRVLFITAFDRANCNKQSV